MPELPEVETIRRELQPALTGRKISGCSVLRPDIVGYPPKTDLCKLLAGETVTDVRRRAKYLVVDFAGRRQMIFHLRLSGALIIGGSTAPVPKFTRLILEFGGRRLYFVEPRALGRVYIVAPGERPRALKGFFELGREPVEDGFDTAYLRMKIGRRRAYIKTLLLDQKICAGVGNIYSDEALFAAGIRPRRRAAALSRNEIYRLVRVLRKVIARGIAHLGTSVSDYVRTDGARGNFQKLLKVYGKEGEPCPSCGTPIKITKIAGRSSRYCPHCQR